MDHTEGDVLKINSEHVTNPRSHSERREKKARLEADEAMEEVSALVTAFQMDLIWHVSESLAKVVDTPTPRVTKEMVARASRQILRYWKHRTGTTPTVVERTDKLIKESGI